MSGLKLEELNWGVCNDLIDTNQAQITGDPRRTTPLGAVQRMTQAAFAPDAVGTRDEYNGFVVSSQQINYATYRNRASMFQSYAAPPASGTPTEYDNIAYKVYIPELMPQPPPPSTVTAEEAAIIFATYPDVFPELEINEKIPHGSLVTVRYENPQYLTNPRIVNIIERSVAVIIAGESISGQYARGAPNRSRAGRGHGGPIIQSPTTDDGSFSWSNNAKQLSCKWNAPADSGYAQWNGQDMKNGELNNTPSGFFKEVNGAKLLAPAARDFRRLSAAFKAKFGFPLKGSGYRSYQGQVGARLKRVTGDVNHCGGDGSGSGEHEYRLSTHISDSGRTYTTGPMCIFAGFAATPGRSKHGWGAAIDLKGSRAGKGFFACGPSGTEECTSKSPPAGKRGIFRGGTSEPVYFQWLNKFSTDFNLILSVKNERWHLNWIKFNDYVINLPSNQRVSTTRSFAADSSQGKSGQKCVGDCRSRPPTYGPPRTA